MKHLLLLPGDGVGPEVITQAQKILTFLRERRLCEVSVLSAAIGGVAIDAVGTPLPEDTRQAVGTADAVLLGAIGGYKWDHLPREQKPETGLLALRQMMQVYANLRPATILPGLFDASSLREKIAKRLNLLIVRELTGGIYFGEPRGISGDIGSRIGINTEIYAEYEIVRIIHAAFRIAMARNRRLCLVDKANVLESSVLWREVFTQVSADYPAVTNSCLYVDNAAMQLVKNPGQFDVIVTNNIFGDILSDLAAQLVGSIGLLASASLGDQGVAGLYEPIHGSAPDIAGTDSANPLATILSLAMAFRYSLDNHSIADLIERSVHNCLARGYRTADISSKTTSQSYLVGTHAMGDRVCDELCALL